MSEILLKEIVSELKGLRHETIQRLDGLQSEVKSTNKRLDGLQGEVKSTNHRLDKLSKNVDGLNQSVVVLQMGLNDVRYEVRGLKEVFSERVIWQNDSVSIVTREGTVIYGVIQKTPKK